MAIEGEDSKWLLAKARQLKERALGTTDSTRRKQFLLIAAEYQKLAHVVAPSDGALTTNVTGASMRGRIAYLRPEAPVHSEDTGHVQQSSRLSGLVVLAVVTLLAFGLVLIPGDQTEGGLHTIFSAFLD